MANKKATTDYPILEVLSNRWSPYAFSDRSVGPVDLRSIFEAARWAASSYNEQPWTYIVATKENPAEFAKILSCLVEANQAWAKAAPVLALGIVSTKFSANGQDNRVAAHDLGAASASLTLEATSRGLVVHQMAGIDPEKVRQVFNVPKNHEPWTGMAIGYVGDSTKLPDALKQRDLATRPRKPQAQFVFGGTWGQAYQP